MSGPKLLWVAALATTYTVEGKSYGPSAGPVQIPATLAGALGLDEVDAPEEVVTAERIGTSLETKAAQLEDVLRRTADAVLNRQSFLRVPRQTEQNLNGQDLAEAVALGFDELKAELDQAEQAKQALDQQVIKLADRIQSQDTALAERVAEVDTLKARISELEAQLASQGDGENAKPGDVDQRTKAQLKEALDAKSVTYAPNTNRDGLLALAAEHQV